MFDWHSLRGVAVAVAMVAPLSDNYHRRGDPRKEAAHDIVVARFEIRC